MEVSVQFFESGRQQQKASLQFAKGCHGNMSTRGARERAKGVQGVVARRAKECTASPPRYPEQRIAKNMFDCGMCCLI